MSKIYTKIYLLLLSDVNTNAKGCAAPLVSVHLPATSVAGQPPSLHGLLSYLQMLSFVAISRRLIGQAIS